MGGGCAARKPPPLANADILVRISNYWGLRMTNDNHQTVPAAEHYKSGIEGREDELGLTVAMAVRTLQNQHFYDHEVNDAVVKLTFVMLQFAKNHDMWDEIVAHDIATMEGVNKRLGKLVEDSGDREWLLNGLTDDNTCHFQMVLDTHAEPGLRRWKSPYGRVLEVSRRIGQFDLTEEEIHQKYTRPRLLGYAKDAGVEIEVSDWSDDGSITMRLVD